MRRLSLIATTFVLLFSATSADAGGCEKDTDCKGDRICEASTCVSPTPAPANGDGDGDENKEAAAEGDAAEAKAEPTQTDPKDWWKEASREAEAPILQAIFNKMPRPIVNKGGGKLVYQRAVPLVVSDIHNTTARWGGKAQVGVHFLGISKIHTTTTMEDIKEETGGIPYCPLNCSRISEIKIQGNDIALFYDDEIKSWAGKVSDNLAGYTRKMGKQYRTMCTFPVMYSHAPKNSWLDPKEVTAVKNDAVAEIKRYCGID
jgi:hypothetical protein